MMQFDENLVNSIKTSLAWYANTTNMQGQLTKIAYEMVSEKRIGEQLEILQQKVGLLRNRKILEVGSGYGGFLVLSRLRYHSETIGIEPDDPSFAGTFSIVQRLLELNKLPKNLIVNAVGENLPFEDASFDIVYSSNVLEHVQDPSRVLTESIRVLESGGYLQFVFPNYGSFYDGHYAVFWPAYLPKFLVSPYLRLLGKNPAYAKTLRTELNYFSVKRILKPFKGQVEILDWGEDVFKKRMQTLQFSEWASLAKVKSWVKWLHRLKLVDLATWVLVKTKSFTPIILTLRKK